MKRFFSDSLLAASMFGPMCVGLVLMYFVFGFIAWESNPGLWSWEHRFVGTIFGVSFGTALGIRVYAHRRNL